MPEETAWATALAVALAVASVVAGGPPALVPAEAEAPADAPAGVTGVTGVLVGRVTDGGMGGRGDAGGAGGPGMGVVGVPTLLEADACRRIPQRYFKAAKSLQLMLCCAERQPLSQGLEGSGKLSSLCGMLEEHYARKDI